MDTHSDYSHLSSTDDDDIYAKQQELILSQVTQITDLSE